MNDTITTMHAHRSIRQYGPDPIPREHIEIAVRAGQAAATSSAVQAYTVIHVTDPDKLSELAELAGPQEKVEKCGAFFVVCADTRRHRLMCERANKPYESTLERFLVGVIDATLFAQNMTLALESMDYGTCYIGGLRNDLERVDRILDLPDGIYPIYGLCAGTKAQDPIARPRLPIESILHTNGYPSDEDSMKALDSYDETYAQYLKDRGAPPSTWTEAMVSKLSRRSREELAGYFTRKGASLT